MTSTDARRPITLRQMMTQEQALRLAGVIVDIVTRYVPDKQALSQMTLELQRVMHQGEATYGVEDHA
jgi:hypothetical protein